MHVLALITRIHKWSCPRLFALQTLVGDLRRRASSAAHLSSVGGRTNHVLYAVFLGPPILDVAQVVHGVAL